MSERKGQERMREKRARKGAKVERLRVKRKRKWERERERDVRERERRTYSTLMIGFYLNEVIGKK